MTLTAQQRHNRTYCEGSSLFGLESAIPYVFSIRNFILRTLNGERLKAFAMNIMLQYTHNVCICTVNHD